ncbi:MAG: MurR/RpiR family transcriptional regulator [Lachnospiraceae bacterium]|nr:MurR/RpiR family transcriptional regulator [Lachnospiraceae bacterium]
MSQENLNSDMYMQIKLKYNTFSAAHKKLADFILNHPDFVLHQSISEVASACEVGEATISRFCKILGYKSYHDFKIDLVQHLPQGSDNDHLSYVYSGITSTDSISTVAKSILAKDITALNETNKLLGEDTVKMAVDILSEANRIMFFGIGSSLTAALEGCNKFMRITPKASINIETHMQYAAASLMSEDDVAIIVSYSGSTKEIVEIARTAKSRGAKIICITRYLKSPLTHYADISLICCSNERDVHGFSLSMELTQIYLLDVLYTAYFMHDVKLSQKNKSDTASIFSDKYY